MITRNFKLFCLTRGLLTTGLAVVMSGPVVLAKPAGAGDAPASQREGKGQGREGRPAPGAVLERAKQAMSDLNLSADQQAKVDQILASARTEFRSIMEETKDLEPKDRKSRVKEFLTKTRSDISAVLNDEQKQAFDAKLTEAKTRVRERAGQGGQPERLQTAMASLDLTAEQKQSIDGIVSESKTRFQELRKDAEGNGDASKDGTREQARELMRRTREQISEVLTVEQREKMREQMQQDRPEKRQKGAKVNAAPAL